MKMNTTSPCKQKKTKNKGGVSHWGLAILHYKNYILRQKKNYENSNKFPDAQKPSSNFFYKKFEIIIISMIFYDIVILVVKLFRVEAYNNYHNFQHMNFIFSRKFISLFGG